MTAGWLASRWRVTVWVWRLALTAFIIGLAAINATGAYAQLVAAHVGERGAATSLIETQDAALAARIEVAAHCVADLDRRIGQIDYRRRHRQRTGDPVADFDDGAVLLRQFEQFCATLCLPRGYP